MQTSLLQQIASDPIIQQAYHWLCQRRENASDQADVWHLRWHWQRLRPQLQADLRQGRYRFGPLQRIRGQDGVLEVWSARCVSA
jgi:RNA-directed DNA polymerase